MKNDTRQPLAAPYRADRATAASDIVQHVAADDLRHLTEAAAHGIPVYVWSAFLARTRLRAKIAPVGREIWQGPFQPPWRAYEGLRGLC